MFSAIRSTPRLARTFSASASPLAKFNKGQSVEYMPIGGRNSGTAHSTGKIERVITEKTTAGDAAVKVNASKESPRYEIRNMKTGKLSPMKEENIIRALD